MDTELRTQIAALLPPIRAHLLAGVLTFTQAACRLPGVTRIALIGSLTTDTPDLKDADVLVTVADDADLTPLAIHIDPINPVAINKSCRYCSACGLLRTRSSTNWPRSFPNERPS